LTLLETAFAVIRARNILSFNIVPARFTTVLKPMMTMRKILMNEIQKTILDQVRDHFLRGAVLELYVAVQLLNEHGDENVCCYPASVQPMISETKEGINLLKPHIARLTKHLGTKIKVVRFTRGEIVAEFYD
jgi:hypothetical protein